MAEQIRWVIKAVVAGSPDARRVEGLRHRPDHGRRAAPGSGKLFDWSLLGEVPEGPRLILAGGLDPDNVADGRAKVQPWGVDVSTGVEKSPGHKDPMKVKAFIERGSVPLHRQQHSGPTRCPTTGPTTRSR